VLHKERREGVSTCSNSREKDNKNYSNKCLYNIVRRDEIKIIDFGGATYEHEKHTDIINTRQYRAPEVILGKNIDVFNMIIIFYDNKWN